MTDTAILAITENLPAIEWLDFSYCLNITDTAVTSIAAKCKEILVRGLPPCFVLCTPSLSIDVLLPDMVFRTDRR